MLSNMDEVVKVKYRKRYYILTKANHSHRRRENIAKQFRPDDVPFGQVERLNSLHQVLSDKLPHELIVMTMKSAPVVCMERQRFEVANSCDHHI